jgi:hypothetical protein
LPRAGSIVESQQKLSLIVCLIERSACVQAI